MIDGQSLVAALKDCGVTHVAWVPDSELGAWEPALKTATGLQLIRVCREGEAIAIAGGLLLGGKRPLVMMQCTGFFDAGDALRNVIYDLKLPLFLVVGLRGYYAAQRGPTGDTCPTFAEPILKTWKIPYKLFANERTAGDLADEYRRAQAEQRPGAVLLAE
jgi:sulfopyruvate decarboxylase subunit alpha